MPTIGEVVGRIRELENSRRRAAEFLGKTEIESLHSELVLEDGFLRETSSLELDGKTVAGVDGGLLKKEFSGVDVVLSRAVASFFSFEGGKVSDSYSLPETTMFPDVQYIESPLDRRSFNLSSSLIRLQKEVSIALEAVKEEPDLVILDGSVVPQYTDRPDEGTEARELYDDLIEKYTELFRQADRRDVYLAGVIEDSRSKRFCEEVAEQEEVPEEYSKVLRNTKDTNMLEYLMETGERTPVMSYTGDFDNHPALRDIGERAERVRNFYLKTADNATPVRVDFLAMGEEGEVADTLSGLFIPLCSYSSSYGIPSVVVEADQRAKLSSNDMERFSSRLSSALGPLPGVKELRRDTRPF